MVAMLAEESRSPGEAKTEPRGDGDGDEEGAEREVMQKTSPEDQQPPVEPPDGGVRVSHCPSQVREQ